MKMEYNKLTSILLLLLFGLLITSFNSTSLTTIAESSSIIPNENPMLEDLIDHTPFLIDDDDDFIDYGFPGLGTELDPYRIENYNITTTGEYCINMAGYTTKYFVIQNCFLKTDTNYALYLGKYNQMANGSVNVLDNYIISTNSHGLRMTGSYALISGNTVSAYLIGIYLEDGIHNMISDNTINANIGINLDMCNASTITNNTIIDNNWNGISISESSETIITHNNCTNNQNIGLESQDSVNLIITNNTFENNFLGMRLYDTIDCIITNNLLKNNTTYGLEMLSSVGISKIYHNAFIDNYLSGGTSQAKDDSGNQWYDDVLLEGNYWSDWLGPGSYSIDGTAGEFDLYPLNSIPVIAEYSSAYLAILLILAFLAIPLINLGYNKK